MTQDCLPTSDVVLQLDELSRLLDLANSADEPTRSSGEPADFVPTPERIRAEVEEMLAQPTSSGLAEWIEAYSAVGKRPAYLWKWCARAVEITTLPCVDPEHHRDVCDTKTLGVMLDVMLDDVADRGGDDELLEALLGLLNGESAGELSRFPPEVRGYAGFTAELWQELNRRARRYPRYAEFAALLRFDYQQLANVMRYSHLLNGNLDLLNLAEHDLYTPHNMHIMICSTWDLMCSPAFDRTEVGRLREALLSAQWMGRIGNLVTTWQRELGERDFTSGVYARAVSRGELTVEQLRTADRAVIERTILLGRHEEHFLLRWQEHRRHLLSAAPSLHSVDLTRVVRAFERLVCLHMGSRGSK